MQDKELYHSPECKTIDLQVEGVICNSKQGEGTNWGGSY